MQPTLFISDLHLDASRPDITDQFLHFLRADATRARALYILGDLFEAWIGDDDPDADKKRIQIALRELTDAGVPCFIMHGNRDFLIGNRFCAATGCTLLDDAGTQVTIDGRTVLLMHGDVLCTDDAAYQKLRHRVRKPWVKWILGHLPLRFRIWLAAKMRAGSKAHIESSMAQIMDVNATAVARTMADRKVDLLIHGHTHRPAIHTLSVNGSPATRIVLGDWYTQGSVLTWDEHGYQLLNLGRAS